MKMKKEVDPFADVGKVDFSYRAKKKQSRGYRKMVRTIYALAQTPRFQSEIRKLRKKYDIPERGFKAKKNEDLYGVATSYSCSEWKYKHDKTWSVQESDDAHERFEKMKSDLIEIARHANVYYYGFIEALVPFLFFRNVSYKQFQRLAYFHDAHNWDVCSVIDLEYIYQGGKRVGQIEMNPELPDEEKAWMVREEDGPVEEAKQFPIAISMSRYASLQDVLSFVRNNWPAVKEKMAQTSKGDEFILPTRTRLTWDRYEFIWTNRNITPRSRLANMVNKKFGCRVDAIYVRNIIARERRRREGKRIS